MAAEFAWILPLAAGIAVFLAPGWLLGKAFGTPLSPVTSFLGSAAVLFNLVLVLDALGLPLDLLHVGCALAAVSGLIALWVRRKGGFSGGPSAGRPGMPSGTEWIWILPPALALASIVALCLVEPLSGYDNSFRWNYLAEFMISHRSLHGYPPIRMEDFDHYPWCDGIPPLVPVLNFLVYSASGIDAPRLVSIRAAAEFLMLGALVHRYARDFWGKDAGGPAVAVLASSALLVWGIAIEQETGLTAIGLVAMLCFLSTGGDAQARSCALWGGMAAGIGAISREYGLYFVILGAVLLAVSRRRRAIAWFALAALVTAAPWYVRNWILTGNPVYPAMGRFFPTNPVHVEIIREGGEFIARTLPPHPGLTVVTVLLATAGTAALLGIGGLARVGVRALALLAGIALVSLLWAWSALITAGGWTYSMRVLLPAVALGAVLSGWVGAARGPVRVALAVLLSLVSADAARRAWTLPDYPFTPPWPPSFAEWRQIRAQEGHREYGDFWPILVREAGAKFIVVDSPGLQIAVNAEGGHATPFMSPRFAPAIDPSLSDDEAFAQLRALGIRFVTFSVRNPVVGAFVQNHATLRHLADDYAPVADFRGFRIYDLQYLTRRDAKEAPGKPGQPGSAPARTVP